MDSREGLLDAAMKGTYPNPVRQDNFPEAWAFADNQRRIAKKKYVTAKIAPFFSNLTFCVLLFFSAIGLIYDQLSGEFCDFLETIPGFLTVWNSTKEFLRITDWKFAVQVLLLLFAVYLLSFAVCAVFTLLVGAIYHPLKRRQPQGSVKENAQQLLTMARQARRYALGTDLGSSVLTAILMALGVLGILGAFWIMTMKDTQYIIESLTAPLIKVLKPYIANADLLMNIQSNMWLPCVMVEWLLIYLAYTALNRLHIWSVSFLFRYQVPYSFTAQMEKYVLFCEEETGDLTGGEAQNQIREQAEEKRIRALELESYGAVGKAKELLAQAAHGGDVIAMEHYARHWLVINVRDPARYWLECAVETGQASEEARQTLKRIKRRRRIEARYLKPAAQEKPERPGAEP